MLVRTEWLLYLYLVKIQLGYGCVLCLSVQSEIMEVPGELVSHSATCWKGSMSWRDLW
jgi:hypothetical protein